MSNHHNLPTNRRITRGSTKQQTQQLQQQSILLGSGKKSLVNQLGRFASNSGKYRLEFLSTARNCILAKRAGILSETSYHISSNEIHLIVVTEGGLRVHVAHEARVT